MNQDLMQLIKDYATKEHTEINRNLLGKSQDNLIAMLMDLLTTYYNDLNSSTMRETVVALLSGYEPDTAKLGYNGFRHDVITGATRYCEIKPKNVRSDSTARNKPKLNGGGNFTDYSWSKFRRHQEENSQMLVAGFVDGRLVHIFEFGFNEPDFANKLRYQLERRFPNGDITSEYLRSASFSFKDFVNVPTLNTACFVSQQELTDLRGHISQNVHSHLRRFAK